MDRFIETTPFFSSDHRTLAERVAEFAEREVEVRAGDDEQHHKYFSCHVVWDRVRRVGMEPHHRQHRRHRPQGLTSRVRWDGG